MAAISIMIYLCKVDPMVSHQRRLLGLEGPLIIMSLMESEYEILRSNGPS